MISRSFSLFLGGLARFSVSIYFTFPWGNSALFGILDSINRLIMLLFSCFPSKKNKMSENSSSSSSSASTEKKVNIPKYSATLSKELKDALNALSDSIEVQFDSLGEQIRELKASIESRPPPNIFVGQTGEY